eukprot:8835120-Alexandrium_andersonii.AAC.1
MSAPMPAWLQPSYGFKHTVSSMCEAWRVSDVANSDMRRCKTLNRSIPLLASEGDASGRRFGALLVYLAVRAALA